MTLETNCGGIITVLKNDIFDRYYDKLWFQNYYQIGAECTLYLNDHLKYSLEDCLYGALSTTLLNQLSEDHATSI
jgi:hypothetical protein